MDGGANQEPTMENPVPRSRQEILASLEAHRAAATLDGIASLKEFTAVLAQHGRLKSLALPRLRAGEEEYLILAEETVSVGESRAVGVDAGGALCLLRDGGIGAWRSGSWSLDDGTWPGAEVSDLLFTLVAAMSSSRRAGRNTD
jgi:hypothetical protein